MATVTEKASTAIRECAAPTLETIQENVRQLRHAALAGRHVMEDSAAHTRIQVRQHPFLAVGIALGVGALIGCATGFGLARRSTETRQ